MNHFRSSLRCAAWMLACAVTTAAAVEPTPVVVVTGTVVPRTLGSELAATSVLTRADLERSGVSDLVGALNLLGTALVEQLGGSGTVASVRLRGADTRDTLVLLDGVPLNDVTSGQASLQQIPVEWIERVEVVRGNLSALYGANATGGVIQVFTRRGSQDWQARAGVAGGSHGTASANASVGGGAGPVRGRMSLGAERTRGFSAADASIAPAANPDDDGNRRRHAAIALDVDVARGHTLGADARVVRGDAEYDSPSRFSAAGDTHEQYLLQRGLALRGRHALGAAWTLGWRVNDDEEVRRDFGTNAFGPFSFGNTLHHRAAVVDLHGTLMTGLGASVGLERVEQSTDNPTYTRDERTTDVVRLGVQHDADWGGLQANVRHDDTSDFGGATTGLLGARWQLAPVFSLHATVANSFTPPTLDFLFFDCAPFGFVCSNPNLRPEKARNVDLGLQWQQGAHLVRATLFDVRYRDKIANNPLFVPENLARAKNHGLELAARTATGPWRLAAELTLQRPVDADTGEPLRRRAREQFALRAEHDAGAWSAGAALRHVGERPDFAPYLAAPGNAVTLASYTVLDLNARWTLAPQWTLQAHVENLFDRAYEPASGYSGRPRGVFVSLGWRTP